MNRPAWNPQWEPGRAAPRLSFGSDDGPPELVRLEGGYAPPFPQDLQQAPPSGLPRAEVIEPSRGWWTQEGAFGFRYQGPVPSLAGGVIPLTEQLRLPGPPRLWWVHWFRYSRSIADEFTPYGNWDLRGRVTYGVGGAQNIVEVDVAAGIQMSVVCNSIKVDLVTYNPQLSPLATYDPGGVGVVAGAMFGDGSAAGALPPTYTTPIATADGAGVIAYDLPVPDFARSVAFHTNVTDPALLANGYLYFNTPGISGKALNLQTCYDLLTSERGVSIPAYTNQLRLQTAAPFPPGAYAALQFFLAL